MNENLKSHFLSLYCMMLADTNVDPRELEILYKIGIDYGIDRDEINKIVLSSGASDYIPMTLEDKVKYLYDLVRIAWADEEIQDEERILLEKFAIRFGFEIENSKKIIDYLLVKAQNQVPMAVIIKEIKDE
jgi:hypothetical protein